VGALTSATLAAALLAAGLLAAPAPVDRVDRADRAERVERWQGLIEQASTRFGIPARWIEQVIRAESGGETRRDGRPIRSRVGAIGLMQLMPATWEAMRERLGLDADPDDPRANILAGTAFLRMMYDRFGFPGLFAAYNAGPGLYARHLAGAAALPPETRAYLVKVSGAASPTASSPAVRPQLFAIRHEKDPDAAGSNAGPSIFAIRDRTP
jgi:soluble lytic murein transglycosylase-like protein